MSPSRRKKKGTRSEGARRKGRHHTERGKGIWERVGGGCEWRLAGGATTSVFDGAAPEVGGSGNELNDVDGVFGEIDRSDPEGELVKSVVTSSSSSESLHFDESSSSSSSSSSSPPRCWRVGDDNEEVYATRGFGLKNAEMNGRSRVRRSASVTLS